MRFLILHPPVLPYAYTLHHRFARIWEVADYLIRRGFDVSVLDAGLLNALKGQVLAEFARGYAGIAIYAETQMIPTVLDLAHRCKVISPTTRILVYGPGPANFPKQLKQQQQLDAIGRRGDFDVQVRQFFELVESPGSWELSRPSNIAVRSGEVWIEPAAAEYSPPAEWGYPNLTAMPMDDLTRIYRMKGEVLTVAVTAAKGCPYPCTFCSTPNIEGGPDRRRDALDLSLYIASSPFKMWQMYAPTFTLNRRWCLSFFEFLRANAPDIRWKCTTRVDRLDDELVDAMAGAGCYMVGLGVETLGPTLARIKKHTNSQQIERSIQMLLQRGIVPKAYIMLALPGQTIDEVRATVDFVAGLGAKVRPALYSPQGEADGLRDEVQLGDSLEVLSSVDGKSFSLNEDHFGEYLRMTFGGHVSASKPLGASELIG